MTESKTQKLVDAAKERARLAKEADEKGNTDTVQTGRASDNLSDNAIETMKEGAEEMAELKVQSRANTLDGEIDVEAMGDVKGDGRDAKDYPDDDPDKALGVPVYEHGLHATSGGVDETEELRRRAEPETRQSKRTQEEMQRGKEVLTTRTPTSRATTRQTEGKAEDKTNADVEAERQAERKAKAEAEARKAEEDAKDKTATAKK